LRNTKRKDLKDLIMRNVYVTVCYPDEHVAAYKIQAESEDTTINILERVFAEWNAGSGSECDEFIKLKCRSLSVNDVVIVDEKHYQCANVGWNQISAQEFLDLEKAVAYHPQRFSDGAWIALDRVMWDRRRNLNTV